MGLFVKVPLGKVPPDKKNFVTENSLRMYIGAFFMISVVVSVSLYRYANRTLPPTSVQSVVASDTIAGDITIENTDSLELSR